MLTLKHMRGALSILVLTVALELLAAPALPDAAPEEIDVVYLNMSPPEDAWTQRFVGTMEGAARDLGIRLTVVQASHWPAETLATAERVLYGPQRPDYLVMVMRTTIGVRLLRLAEQARVPVVVINTGFTKDQAAQVGGPREHFSVWIGQILPDDEKAGYDLANTLISEARRQRRFGTDGRIHVVALTGLDTHPAAIEREKGLRRAVGEHEDVVLHQVAPAKGKFDEAKKKTALLLQRFPETSVIWAANDLMALGAIEALTVSGRDPGRDVIVGGMNWDPAALEAVRRGDLAVTFGGHHLEAAWALVLIYDHAHGVDFGTDGIDLRTELIPVTRENVDAVLRAARPIDFRSFSRAANPGRTGYAFTPEVALEPRRRAGPGP